MRFLLAALALIGVANALPTFTRTAPPTGWTLGSRAPATASVKFTIALQQRNLDILNEKFEAISTPGSPQYRNFMTKEQVLDIVSPSQHDKKKVTAWLKSHGVTKFKDMGDAIDVQTTVHNAESLFRTFFHYYSDNTNPSNKIIRQYGTYSVDQEVEHLIHMVPGISTFPIPHYKAIKAKRTSMEAANDGIVAESIQSLYTVPSKLGLATGTSQGVIEFEQQYFAPADLVTYGTDVGITLPVIPAAQIVGTNVASSPQTESSLDVDMEMSINVEASPWFWIEDGTGWLYTYANHFFSTTSVPQVVSISYGWSEADQCSISQECSSLGVTSQQYVERVNAEFQKIGARGTTIVVSSGDSGCHGRTDGGCTSATALPDFPGSSPYVLSVGATELINSTYSLKNPPSICTSQGYSCISAGYEQAVSFAVSNFASGGGFSNIASQPTWQTSAVKSYLTGGAKLPPSTFFNSTSRGYPDVAAVGHANLIVQGGAIESVGGTSASSPIWASIIAFLNQAAMAKDGKPLGFINPLLYSIAASTPSAFHDITTGDNICTEDGCATTCQGFVAAKGWDPVTGLGSPNFPNLLAAVQASL